MSTIVVGEYAFDTTKQLGKGRFSTVYEGQHAEKGTKVAIKKVDWSALPASKRDNLVNKLKQAVELHKTKSHEHVLKLLDYQVSEYSFSISFVTPFHHILLMGSRVLS